jgi:hypothetical protein
MMIAKSGRPFFPIALGTLVMALVCLTFASGRATAAPAPDEDKATAGQDAPPPSASGEGLTAKRLQLHGILDRATNENDGIHDACGDLYYFGNESSIPHLIRVLRLFGDTELPLPPGVGFVCTQWHCVAALERLTGVKVGVSYASWKRWWETSHPGEPLDPPPSKRNKPAPGATPRR